MRASRWCLWTVFVLFFLAGWTGITPLPAADSAKATIKARPVASALYWDIVDKTERYYYRDVELDTSKAPDLTALFEQLDPYTHYISPEQMYQYSRLDGDFVGIGVQIEIRDDYLTVVAPIVGSPAHRAGVLPGDQIIKVNGESTQGITLPEAVQRITGRKGTTVRVTIRRPGESQPIELELKRNFIKIETVTGDRRQDESGHWSYVLAAAKDVAYAAISEFNEQTAGDLRKVLARLKRQDVRGLVLDLRYNPGGLLDSGVDVANLFVKSGQVAWIQGRDGKRHQRKASWWGTFSSIPLVVLVNEYSASAAEIVASALQDHHRATVIGVRTWGKGSVQNIYDLEGGKSALKLTTALWLRPTGESFHRERDSKDWGVHPDIEVKMSEDDTRAALRIRNALALPPSLRSNTKLRPILEVDVQLQRAVERLSRRTARR